MAVAGYRIGGLHMTLGCRVGIGYVVEVDGMDRGKGVCPQLQ